jgi:hypothetical protein
MMHKIGAVLVFSLGWAALAFACAGSPSSSDGWTIAAVSPSDFNATTAGVGVVFERHCGSFDCHGNTARAMRIYSQNGLRLPNEAGILPGTAPTTPEEISANYRSIISLEPEQMNAVTQNNADPYSLLILKKPLEIETHKGGPVLNKGDDPEKCITSWVQNKMDATAKIACTKAANYPQ